ncbi:Smr domain-containing protein [Dictyocoela muelleri]|nr:Smr domain-containing protein [Dictyocoela muelleri]
MDKKKILKEMFPDTPSEKLNQVINSHDTLESMINTLLNPDISVEIPLKTYLESIKVPRSNLQKLERKLYFPEIFGCNDNKIYDHFSLRKEARQLYELRDEKFERSKEEFKRNGLFREVAVVYSDEAEELNRKAKEIDRKACISVIREMMMRVDKDTLDLHNLYVKEALMLVSDYLNINKPSVITLIVGQSFSSHALRPSVIEFLDKKNYDVNEDGPKVIGWLKKKIL